MDIKAQAGIGTMIIFLAGIIVAAITANVLVQTATSLQNQALESGKQAQKSISTIAQALGVSAMNATDNTIEDFRMDLKLSPGSEPINMQDALLTLSIDDASYDLTYSNKSCTNSLVSGYYTNASEGNGTFSIKYLLKSPNHREGILQRGELATLCFASGKSIGEDRDIDIRFVPGVGMPTALSIVTKNVMNNYIVNLYP